VRTVPDVHKAVKWNEPFYGHEGDGWFVAFRCYTKYVQLQFFRGTSLDPMPPKASKHDETTGNLDSRIAVWKSHRVKSCGPSGSQDLALLADTGRRPPPFLRG
jgi:hypothetical protein